MAQYDAFFSDWELYPSLADQHDPLSAPGELLCNQIDSLSKVIFSPYNDVKIIDVGKSASGR